MYDGVITLDPACQTIYPIPFPRPLVLAAAFGGCENRWPAVLRQTLSQTSLQLGWPGFAQTTRKWLVPPSNLLLPHKGIYQLGDSPSAQWLGHHGLMIINFFYLFDYFFLFFFPRLFDGRSDPISGRSVIMGPLQLFCHLENKNV